MRHDLVVVDTAQQDTATTTPDLQTFVHMHNDNIGSHAYRTFAVPHIT